MLRLAERQAAPGRAQACAERCRVGPVAGDVAYEKRDPAVLELHAVVEVAAEVEPLLTRPVDRRDVHARVGDFHDRQERLLEPADERLDLPVRLLLTLQQKVAGRALELQLEQKVVRPSRSADGQGDRRRRARPRRTRAARRATSGSDCSANAARRPRRDRTRRASSRRSAETRRRAPFRARRAGRRPAGRQVPTRRARSGGRSSDECADLEAGTGELRAERGLDRHPLRNVRRSSGTRARPAVRGWRAALLPVITYPRLPVSSLTIWSASPGRRS